MFQLWRDTDRVALKRRLHSRAEAGRFEAWISMRGETIKIEKLVSKSVHLKGPVSPMGPMIHEFDEDTEWQPLWVNGRCDAIWQDVQSFIDVLAMIAYWL